MIDKNKVNFNIIEKYKSSNTEDIKHFINNAVNKLIINDFFKSIN